MSELAQLEKIDIRKKWENEPQHFTPWLAHKGLTILAETLGLNLQIIDTEVQIGRRFWADVHARNTADDTDVVIENQFGESDHKHLGQILTYAAGITPKTIIWIAETFTEEHRDALDYLNKITKKRIRFFGVTIALYRIGESDPAPQFQVICKPRYWTKETQKTTNDTKQLQLRYWTRFYQYAKEKNSLLNLRNPIAENYLQCSRRDKVDIHAYHNLNRHEIGVALYLKGDTERLDLLNEQREEIEKKIGELLYWDNPTQIYLSKNESDPRDESQWEKQHQWILEKLELFDRVFRPIFHKLNASENAPTP